MKIKDYFSSESDFVLMSIGVDLSESEAQLETFASSYDMTWWVFRDTVNMDVYYNIEFIPSLVIVNPTQYVYYTEIGMSDTQHIIDIIEDLLDFSDSDTPDMQPPISFPAKITLLLHHRFKTFKGAKTDISIVSGENGRNKRVKIHQPTH